LRKERGRNATNRQQGVHDGACDCRFIISQPEAAVGFNSTEGSPARSCWMRRSSFSSRSGAVITANAASGNFPGHVVHLAQGESVKRV
jgi:hypothetical protein